MGSFEQQITMSLHQAGLDTEKLGKVQRIAWIRNLWTELVDQDILDHTNAVYIFEKDGVKEMHVYVDDSIYAAELNSRRELISMQCRSKYGELIDSFSIHISYGERKKEHPFTKGLATEDKGIVRELSPEEIEDVEIMCKNIPNDVLREKFKQAMIADLQWIRPKNQ